jgi:hypothetical protein
MAASCEERYLGWCARRGALTGRVRVLRSSLDGLRGLHTSRSVRRGDVIFAVPWSACFTAQNIRSSQLPRATPRAWHIQRLLSNSPFTPFEARVIHLAVLAATLSDHTEWGPLLQEAKLSVRSPPPSLSTTAALDDLRGIERAHQGALHGVTLLHQCLAQRHGQPTHWDEEALTASFRGILARMITVPRNCASSAPMPLDPFLDQLPDSETVPALVPLVDMINSPRQGQSENAELYTCGPSGNRDAARQLVAAVATHDIPESEEILVHYNLSDPAASWFRWGFVP